MSDLYANQMCSECGAMGDSMIYEDGYICYPKCWDKSRAKFWGVAKNRSTYVPEIYSGARQTVDKGEE